GPEEPDSDRCEGEQEEDPDQLVMPAREVVVTQSHEENELIAPHADEPRQDQEAKDGDGQERLSAASSDGEGVEEQRGDNNRGHHVPEVELPGLEAATNAPKPLLGKHLGQTEEHGQEHHHHGRQEDREKEDRHRSKPPSIGPLRQTTM